MEIDNDLERRHRNHRLNTALNMVSRSAYQDDLRLRSTTFGLSFEIQSYGTFVKLEQCRAASPTRDLADESLRYCLRMLNSTSLIHDDHGQPLLSQTMRLHHRHKIVTIRGNAAEDGFAALG